MSALPSPDPLARALAPVVREMLLAEVQRLAASMPKKTKAEKADQEIMFACRSVAAASDALAQAKYGAGEIAARKRLDRAATALRRCLRRHGRMPKEA